MPDPTHVGKWKIGRKLGSGHFATVKLGTHSETGKECAIKILKKPQGTKKLLVQTEVDILKQINHPVIVRCYDVIDIEEEMAKAPKDPVAAKAWLEKCAGKELTPGGKREHEDKVYFMMELMSGGELFDRIVDKGHFTEKDAIGVSIKLIQAINYLHSKGIAHRDLKPENMLMTSNQPDAEVKITDFGLSKFFDGASAVMQTPCGTPGYIAPEVLRMKGYGKECDVWSLGVIIYILLCGFPPFYADNDAQLYEKIKRGEFEFLRPYWDPISDKAKDLIRKMLTVDPKKRITCEGALAHPWLADQAAALCEEMSTVVKLQENAKLKLKAGVIAVEALNRMSNEGSSS